MDVTFYQETSSIFIPGFLNLGSAAPFVGFRGKIKKIKNILAQMKKKKNEIKFCHVIIKLKIITKWQTKILNIFSEKRKEKR